VLLHVSNLLHFGYLLIVWSVIVIYVNRTAANRFRTTLRLLQIIPFLFALDLIVGVTLIDKLYGNQASASWLSKSVVIYPVVFVAAVWFMLRSRRQQKNG
jgi:uncharacterized membrane protein YhaH (DUF805 family)